MEITCGGKEGPESHKCSIYVCWCVKCDDGDCDDASNLYLLFHMLFMTKELVTRLVCSMQKPTNNKKACIGCGSV